MRVLLDTNVVLDVLLRRGEWLSDAETIWQAGIDGRLICCMTASSLTDIYYIARRLASVSTARQVVLQCLDCLELLTVDQEILEAAYGLETTDFEDALQIAGCANEFQRHLSRQALTPRRGSTPQIDSQETRRYTDFLENELTNKLSHRSRTPLCRKVCLLKVSAFFWSIPYR